MQLLSARGWLPPALPAACKFDLMSGNSKKIINFYHSFTVTHQTHIQGIVVNINSQGISMNIQQIANGSPDSPQGVLRKRVCFSSQVLSLWGTEQRKGWRWMKRDETNLAGWPPKLMLYLSWIATHIIKARWLAALSATSNQVWIYANFIHENWSPILTEFIEQTALEDFKIFWCRP